MSIQSVLDLVGQWTQIPDPVFNAVLVVFVVVVLIAFFILLFISAPYGKQDREGWGPGIPMRLGWVLLELPAVVVFAYYFFQGDKAWNIVPLVLFALWQIHYIHRTFIYPFQIRVKPGATYKILLILIGVFLNSINGYLNGIYLSQWADHLTNTWLLDWRFIIGVIFFFTGFFIAKQSDRILRNLRKPGETGYKIPKGGFYRWISCPNYMGELLEWLGFAIAAWSLPALLFFLYSAANLVPRAMTSHSWYKDTFSDYPSNRKALIPGLL